MASVRIHDDPWSLRGHRGHAIPNILVSGEAPSDALALLIPGIVYSCDAPLLYYTGRLFQEPGYDVLVLTLPYGRDLDYRTAARDVQAQWRDADADALIEAVLSRSDYSRLAVAAKSLGTTAMYRWWEAGRLPDSADLVWLTPMLAVEPLERLSSDMSLHSLFLIGTADGLYDRVGYARL